MREEAFEGEQRGEYVRFFREVEEEENDIILL